jgi:hypothetical protein
MIAENKIMATKDSILATAEKKAKTTKKRRAAKPEKLPFQIAMQDNLLRSPAPNAGRALTFGMMRFFSHPPNGLGGAWWAVVPLYANWLGLFTGGR